MNPIRAVAKLSRMMLTSEDQIGHSSYVVQDLASDCLRQSTSIKCNRLNDSSDNWTTTVMAERMRYFPMGNALVVPWAAHQIFL